MKVVLRPGAAPPVALNVNYIKRDNIHFGHFGSLASTRNLSQFIKALHLLFIEHPTWQQHVILDIYGTGLDDISKKSLKQFSLGQTIQDHGQLSRQQVFEAMKLSDVLLILHGSGVICEEYVPSKVYEYLLTGRPVLALTPATSELGRIVLECGHQVADPDNAYAIKETLAEYIIKWKQNGLGDVKQNSPYTIEKTVNKILAIALQIE